MAAFMKWPLWSGSGLGGLFEMGVDHIIDRAFRLLLMAQRGVFLLASFPSASQNQ